MFFHVFLVLLTLYTVWLCFFSVTFIDLFSCIAASLFNKLTYLLGCGVWVWRISGVLSAGPRPVLGVVAAAAKTAEPIEITFGGQSCVDLENRCTRWGRGATCR